MIVISNNTVCNDCNIKELEKPIYIAISANAVCSVRNVHCEISN